MDAKTSDILDEVDLLRWQVARLRRQAAQGVEDACTKAIIDKYMNAGETMTVDPENGKITRVRSDTP